MTLAQLCQHNQITEHPLLDGEPVSQSRMMRITDEERALLSMCPGGILLPPGSLVIIKEDGKWPAGMRYWWDLFETLLAMQRQEDALAAGQITRGLPPWLIDTETKAP